MPLDFYLMQEECVVGVWAQIKGTNSFSDFETHRSHLKFELEMITICVHSESPRALACRDCDRAMHDRPGSVMCRVKQGLKSATSVLRLGFNVFL